MQKIKIASMIVKYFYDWEYYTWEDAGRPYIPEQIEWLESDPEGVKTYFREMSEDRSGSEPDPAADAAAAILEEMKKAGL